MHRRFDIRPLRFLLAAAAIGASLSGSGFDAIPAAHAESVFKCKARDGSIAFQDHACGGAQTQSTVEILPAPPPSASPDYGVDSRAPAGRAARSTRGNRGGSTEATSFECRASNGEVFYRHGGCPKSITAAAKGKSKGRGRAEKETVSVSAHPLPRGEVCRRLHAAGSIGRDGHDRDEAISSYEKNLGRDPCRRY